MVNKTKKIFFILLFVIFSAPIAGILLITYSPKVLLPLSEYFSPYKISAEIVDIQLSTPRIILKTLKISNNDNQVAAVEQFNVSTTWGSLWFDVPQWSGSISNAAIYVENISKKTSNTETSRGSYSSINLHKFLKAADVSLSNVQVYLRKDEIITLHHINKLSNLDGGQQGVGFSFEYQKQDEVFPVEGDLLSVANNDSHEVRLSIPQLNFKNFPSSPKAKENASKLSREEAIDWSLLFRLAPVTFVLQSEEIQFPSGELNAVESRLNLSEDDGGVVLTQHHNAQMKAVINNDFLFFHPIRFESELQPLSTVTRGADLEGRAKLTFSDTVVAIDGQFNVNGVVGNDFSLNASAKKFPLEEKSPSVADVVKQQIEQSKLFFPLMGNAKFLADNKKITLSEMVFKTGRSDIEGDIALNINNASSGKISTDDINSVDFDIHSKNLIVPADIKASGTKLKKTHSSKKLFSNRKINVDWLNNLTVKGQLGFDRVVYDNRVLLEKSVSDISLKDRILSIDSKAKNLAKGKLNIKLKLNGANRPLKLSAQGSLKNAKLESLALLPEGEFKGGGASFNFSLNGQGDSAHALASRLRGNFLLVGRNSTITNNSFELIGSDLLLNLVNSINPLYKKTRQTKLECAVVNSKIEQGKLFFDDSIALKTSNVIIIADGEIDLVTEKINLDVNPKARSGVGIDLASLAKFIAIKGTLKQPEVGASASGSLTSAAKIGAALSTGGLSLVADSLLDKASSIDPCEKALKAFTQ